MDKDCQKDKENRVALLQLCKEKLEENSNFLQRLIFSDERSSLLHGAVSKRIFKICASQRPKTVYEPPQSSSKLTVWGAICQSEVIWPFLDHGTVSGNRWKTILRYYLFRSLSGTLPTIFSIYWGFFALRDYGQAIPGRKVSKRVNTERGPIPWFTRSADLAFVSFYLRLLKISSIMQATAEFFWLQDEYSSSCCYYYKRNSSKEIQTPWQYTVVCN